MGYTRRSALLGFRFYICALHQQCIISQLLCLFQKGPPFVYGPFVSVFISRCNYSDILDGSRRAAPHACTHACTHVSASASFLAILLALLTFNARFTFINAYCTLVPCTWRPGVGKAKWGEIFFWEFGNWETARHGTANCTVPTGNFRVS